VLLSRSSSDLQYCVPSFACTAEARTSRRRCRTNTSLLYLSSQGACYGASRAATTALVYGASTQAAPKSRENPHPSEMHWNAQERPSKHLACMYGWTKQPGHFAREDLHPRRNRPSLEKGRRHLLFAAGDSGMICRSRPDPSPAKQDGTTKILARRRNPQQRRHARLSWAVAWRLAFPGLLGRLMATWRSGAPSWSNDGLSSRRASHCSTMPA
jgi:hypothetical protein